jgi:hypothetical protein
MVYNTWNAYLYVSMLVTDIDQVIDFDIELVAVIRSASGGQLNDTSIVPYVGTIPTLRFTIRMFIDMPLLLSLL